jgi:hypothetical protein
MTLHSTSAAFNRYFQTGGENMRRLLEGRKALATPDNGLAMDFRDGAKVQTLDFKRK